MKKFISLMILISAGAAGDLPAATLIGEPARIENIPRQASWMNLGSPGISLLPRIGATPHLAPGLSLISPSVAPAPTPAALAPVPEKNTSIPLSLQPPAEISAARTAIGSQREFADMATQDIGASLDQSKEFFDGAGPMKDKPSKGIPSEWIKKKIEESKAADPQSRRLQDIAQRMGFRNTSINREIQEKHNENYTVAIPQGPITNQQQSGRCWIFAGLNMIRSMMIAEKRVPKDFEFSENYLHFFNMLEKSNRHMADVVDKIYKRHAKAEKFDSRKRRMTVTPDIGDGGWSEYFMFLVSKYGLAPKSAMGETISALGTATLLSELDDSLAATAAEMMANAKQYKAGRAENKSVEIKERGMNRVWKILATHLGTPPERFEYRKIGAPKPAGGTLVTPAKVLTFTPKEFAAKVARFDPEDYVSIASYPGKKAGTLYEIKKSAIGAAEPGRSKFDLRFINVTPERLEKLAATAIKGGQPLWFAADVSRDVDHKTGIMHPDIFERDPVYQFSEDEKVPALTRKEVSYFGRISPNHAMVLTGYDQPDPKGPIVKFKVENSWGDLNGSKGIYHLYHEWFNQNVFEIVVHKKFLDKTEDALWNGKPTYTKNKD